MQANLTESAVLLFRNYKNCDNVNEESSICK